MAHLLIVAHAPLASSLQAVAQHVYPDLVGAITAVDVMPGMAPEEVKMRLRQELMARPGTDTLILADVFGATPCNAALEVADGVRSRVVAGVNVPMLWRALCYADRPLADLVERAVMGAAQGVMQVGTAHLQGQTTVPGSHDQVEHNDQQ